MSIRTAFVSAFLICPALALAAESHTFDSDGVRLRFVTEGSGETVVLLHGFSGSAEGLYIKPGTFQALVDAGYHVVAMDQRGHGQSEKLYEADRYGINMVEDVRRLLDHLEKEKVHLVGYSMGARVSNTFRSMYSERLLTITLGGYGWPWQGSRVTLEASKERMKTRTVLPGNDIDALAAVSVGSYELVPSEESMRSNSVPAFGIIGDKDEVISSENLKTFRETMANLEMEIIPGTHAGPDGAPYKPIFGEKLIEFLGKH